MKRHLLLIAVLAVLLAAFLGACGGDDDDDGTTQAPVVTAPGPTAPADAGTTGTTGKQINPGSKKKSEKAAEKKSERAKKKREKARETEAAFEDPDSKEAQAKLSYTAAKRVCKERKLEDLKSVYKPKGTGAKAIAKAVSGGYTPKHRADAAYAGCLAGYKQR